MFLECPGRQEDRQVAPPGRNLTYSASHHWLSVSVSQSLSQSLSNKIAIATPIPIPTPNPTPTAGRGQAAGRPYRTCRVRIS